MTPAEITALRIEFEDAILKACNDFQAQTCVAVRQIYLQTIDIERFGLPTEHAVTKAHVHLHGL